MDGIPYTAKDSYLVKGLTAASGSPAFAKLVAYRDAFTIERLRAAGAICLGKTNMPPMANGFAPSAWPKKPGRVVVARRRTTACAPTPHRAG